MLKPLTGQLEVKLQEQQAFSKFRFRKTRRSFERRAGDTAYAVHFSYVSHVSDFDTTCDIAIRLDEVEEIFNRTRTYLSSAERKHTYTIGVELGNLRGSGQKRWRVASSDDVTFVAEDICAWAQELVFPFFEQYTDRKAVILALADGDKARLIAPLKVDRLRAAFRELGYSI